MHVVALLMVVLDSWPGASNSVKNVTIILNYLPGPKHVFKIGVQ